MSNNPVKERFEEWLKKDSGWSLSPDSYESLSRRAINEWLDTLEGLILVPDHPTTKEQADKNRVWMSESRLVELEKRVAALEKWIADFDEPRDKTK